MPAPHCTPTVLLLLILATSLPAPADELRFRNGDRLSGTFVSLEEKKIRFKSDLVGEVVVGVELIETFATLEPIEIHLSDETVLHDTALAWEPPEPQAPALAPIEPEIVPETGEPGEAPADGAEAAPAPPDGLAMPEPVPEPPAPDEAVVADAGLYRVAGGSAVGPQVFRLSDTVVINPPEVDPVDWKGHLAAGAQFERGNSITDSANANLEIIRRGLESRFTARASYLSDRDSDPVTRKGTTSDREIDGFLKYDFFLTEKWYIFQRLSGEKDGVIDLDLRLVVGTGMGYQWVERKALNFSTEVGLAWTDERYKDSALDNDYLTATLRWDLDSRFFDRLTFFHRGDWRPSLDESDVMVIDTVTGLRSDLTDSFFLEAKAVWEWDSQPSTGKKRQDVDYILGLGYRFD